MVAGGLELRRTSSQSLEIGVCQPRDSARASGWGGVSLPCERRRSATSFGR